MHKLSRTARAERDFIEIWTYIAAANPVAADRLLDHLEERSRFLAEEPELGPAREDIAPGFRYLPVGNYVILYRYAHYGIEVVRYVHGRRDLFALLR